MWTLLWPETYSNTHPPLPSTCRVKCSSPIKYPPAKSLLCAHRREAVCCLEHLPVHRIYRIVPSRKNSTLSGFQHLICTRSHNFLPGFSPDGFYLTMDQMDCQTMLPLLLLFLVSFWAHSGTARQISEPAKSSLRPVELAWGIAEVQTPLGRLFNYTIQKDAFDGDIANIKVRLKVTGRPTR